jgi:putative acetyltransferase
MTSEILITRADPRDAAVRRLVEALDAYMHALYPVESNHLLDIETMCQPQMSYFAVSVDGEVMGCGGFWAHNSFAEVKRVYVDQRSRGQGLARRLMAHIEQEMRAAGFTQARLETGVSQPEALGLYHALGYRTCEPFGDYPTDDPLSVFMEKRL